MKQSLLLLMVFVAGCDTGDNSNRFVGQLESDRIEITAEVPEPITEKIVVEGQAVTAGEPLMQQAERPSAISRLV